MKSIPPNETNYGRAVGMGYMYELQINTGRVMENAETNLGSTVVKDFRKNLVGNYHYIYLLANSHAPPAM